MLGTVMLTLTRSYLGGMCPQADRGLSAHRCAIKNLLTFGTRDLASLSGAGLARMGRTLSEIADLLPRGEKELVERGCVMILLEKIFK